MLVKDIRLQIAGTLFLIAIISLWRFFSLNPFYNLLSVLLITQLVELTLNYLIYKKKPYLSYSAVVTSLIIFLLIDKASPTWIFILTAIIAISSKYIIKFGPKHIFNPAAFGAFIVSLIPGVSISWWGVAWSPLLSLIIIAGSLLLLKKLRRLYIVGGFLLIYLLFYIYSTHSLLGFKTLVDGTVILFAFIILPEPQTTPISGLWLKSFGMFVAFLMIGILISFPKFPYDPLIASLLAADLLSFLIININAKRTA